VSEKDRVNYRALTDKAIVETPVVEGDENPAEEAKTESPKAKDEDADIEELEGDRLIQLGKGFKAFLPGAVKKKRGSAQAESGHVTSTSDGLCTIDGECFELLINV